MRMEARAEARKQRLKQADEIRQRKREEEKKKEETNRRKAEEEERLQQIQVSIIKNVNVPMRKIHLLRYFSFNAGNEEY